METNQIAGTEYALVFVDKSRRAKSLVMRSNNPIPEPKVGDVITLSRAKVNLEDRPKPVAVDVTHVERSYTCGGESVPSIVLTTVVYEDANSIDAS